MDSLQMNCIERVLIVTRDLTIARQRWAESGFALSAITADRINRVRVAQFAAGAITLELFEPLDDAALAASPGGALLNRFGGVEGVTGWIWGCARLAPNAQAPVATSIVDLRESFPGTFTAVEEEPRSFEERKAGCQRRFGPNTNGIAYLDHIVIMVPDLPSAIAGLESLGLQCKRVRDAGRGRKQAFFRLDQTVLEVVGPSPDKVGVWGLAFMCGDLDHAVATARAAGLQATEPKTAVQGGRIARVVEPLSGVAIAYLEAPQADSVARD
jgi:predicted enzyme related to lactoylglutathione lyase